MKKFAVHFSLLGIIVLGFCMSASAVDIKFNGDLDHRFLVYTNHNDWFQPEQAGSLVDGSVPDNYGEFKYRFGFVTSDDDDNVKAVYTIEIGGVRFGRTGTGKSQGGSWSGDGVNIETRFAYLDTQLPFTEKKSRLKVGLIPMALNSFLWKETATGIELAGNATDAIDYSLGWIRSIDSLARTEATDSIKDVDSFMATVGFKQIQNLECRLFGLYTNANAQGAPQSLTPRDYLFKRFSDAAEVKLLSVGTDGSFKSGPVFANWDLIYQNGQINNVTFDDSEFSGFMATGDFDVSAFLAHLDVGTSMGNAKLTYTFWYASGDDNPKDNEFNSFLSYDVDRADSLIFFEGNYGSDATYFTERPYILDKGLIFNKLALDYQVTEKFKVGTAALYLMTAQDIVYPVGATNKSENQLGIEVNGYLSYKLWKNVEALTNAGYLFAGDAMDAFEVKRDGNVDENIFVSSARLRYKF